MKTDLTSSTCQPVIPAAVDQMAERYRLIDGLRRLADFLEANPALPTAFSEAAVTYFPEGTDDDATRSEVDRIASLMDASPHSEAGGEHYVVAQDFGPVSYRAVAITAARMARRYAAQTYADSVVPDQVPHAS